MNDDQPTQPLTGCELDDIEGRWLRYVALRDPDSMETSVHDVPDLLAEVDRLRAENHGVTDENSALLRKLEEQYRLRAENARLRAELATTHRWLDELEAAAGYGSLADVLADYEERGLSGDHATRLRSKRVKSMAATITEETAWRHQYLTDIESERDRLQEELEGWKDNAEDTLRMYDKLKMESVGTALGHLAKIKRLQSERDALVRKLGLDWGPDEFGDLSGVPDPSSGDVSDGYHTHNELYEYRMLYNAHAARGWLASGHRVVKSWRHSDGELCFGGGWFVVVAELPTGQVTNHYEAEHWELFEVPEKLPTAYDGHSPAEAAHRLRQALGFE